MDVIERIRPLAYADKWSPRVNIAAPFVREILGRRHAVATNGHALVALPFDGEIKDAAEGLDIAGAVASATAPSTHEASIAELRAWAGEPQPDTETCPKCNGTPPVVCGECEGEGVVEAHCDCPNCDGKHDCEHCGGGSKPACVECEGDGIIRKRGRAGAFAVGLISMDLLGRVLRTAPDNGTLQIVHKAELSPITLRAGEWLAVVMPMRGSADPTAPVAPLRRVNP